MEIYGRHKDEQRQQQWRQGLTAATKIRMQRRKQKLATATTTVLGGEHGSQYRSSPRNLRRFITISEGPNPKSRDIRKSRELSSSHRSRLRSQPRSNNTLIFSTTRSILSKISNEKQRYARIEVIDRRTRCSNDCRASNSK